MNIVEFLGQVGPDNLRFQYLHECIRGAEKIRGAVEVRFGTTEMGVSDAVDPTRVGVIVWMDRAEFDRVQATIGGPR